MKKQLAFAYGVVAYLMFLGVYAYLVGFLANIGVPKSIDSGEPSSQAVSFLVNLGLLVLFGVQHSVMARPGFKRIWTKIVPKPIERSTYVFISNLLLMLLFWQWRPLVDVVWSVSREGQNGAWFRAAYAVFIAGVFIVPAATLFISHFDLFGLRQVLLHLRGKDYRHLPFSVPGPYKFVRHPLYFGWILMFWATPHMSAGHLLFAVVMTTYILIAIRFEERDLAREFGELYVRYREATPMLLPKLFSAPAIVEDEGAIRI